MTINKHYKGKREPYNVCIITLTFGAVGASQKMALFENVGTVEHGSRIYRRSNELLNSRS